MMILLVLFVLKAYTAPHPSLFLTPRGVTEIKSSIGKYPTFDKSYAEMKLMADKALKSEVIVPVPKDGGGGYTHEKHKNNYYEMNACGIMYQLTGNKAYAQFVRTMLMKYAEMYPTLGLHPAVRSETPGKLFWQALNEAVWLVHTANAYDCVYDFISNADRKVIEKNLFYPIADFISNGNPANYAVFNKMHNHGTWATASVGMIGYVMGDKNLVDMALYGSKKDGKTGFIRQLNVLFSPDGYFTEGPYYQRYAIWPFMTFAQVIENNQPELKIFSYRNGILNKAVHTMLQSTYEGEILLLNDALYKTIQTQEIVSAVNIAYKNNSSDITLLDIASKQNSFVVSDAGFYTAKALAAKKPTAFVYKSIVVRDGEDGTQGGVAIIRNKSSLLTFKATSHGLSHGHYDKLSISYFDNGHQIIPDYGAARFLNIEPKNGGNYTKENYSYAMQTIAHNTVTINEQSHFDAKIKVSSNYHSHLLYNDVSNVNFQVISALDTNAYDNVKMHRTTAMISNTAFEFPIVVDVFRVKGDMPKQLDFPFNYRGQLVSTNFELVKNLTELKPLGTKNGYQHLWVEASAKALETLTTITWVNDNRFYSVNTLTNPTTELKFLRVGANDPANNLRAETSFMIRQPNAQNHTFVSIIEPHGLYDLTKEITVDYKSAVKDLKLLLDTDEYTAVQFTHQSGKTYLLILANNKYDLQTERTVSLLGKGYTLKGNYLFTEIK